MPCPIASDSLSLNPAHVCKIHYKSKDVRICIHDVRNFYGQTRIKIHIKIKTSHHVPAQLYEMRRLRTDPGLPQDPLPQGPPRRPGLR